VVEQLARTIQLPAFAEGALRLHLRENGTEQKIAGANPNAGYCRAREGRSTIGQLLTRTIPEWSEGQ